MKVSNHIYRYFLNAFQAIECNYIKALDIGFIKSIILF